MKRRYDHIHIISVIAKSHTLMSEELRLFKKINYVMIQEMISLNFRNFQIILMKIKSIKLIKMKFDLMLLKVIWF